MRVGMIDTQAIRQRWQSVGSKLDERGRRVFAAGEARAAGWGGLAALSGITGLARSTIGRGLKDLEAAPLPKGRERRKGGGRRQLSSRDATLIDDLRSVIEPATLGDPMRPLLWVLSWYLSRSCRRRGREPLTIHLQPGATMGFTSFSRQGVRMQIDPVPHSGFSRRPGARALLMSDKLKKPLVLTIQFQDSKAKTAKPLPTVMRTNHIVFSILLRFGHSSTILMPLYTKSARPIHARNALIESTPAIFTSSIVFRKRRQWHSGS
jgi:hypothetical protein